MDELIEQITGLVFSLASLPTIIGDTDRVTLSDQFASYWVEGSCVVSLARIAADEDESYWYDHRLKFTIDKLDLQDADGEWHELPKSQRLELQKKLNKSI